MKKLKKHNIVFIFILLFISLYRDSLAQEKKVEFKYKKYEKFDFEDLVIEGEVNSPSELSIFPAMKKNLKTFFHIEKN